MKPLDTLHASIVHALLANAELGADAPSTIVVSETEDAETITHEKLAEASLRAAAIMAESGVRPGDRVMICLPTSPAFLTAFFATMALGAIPVAVPLPGGFGAIDVFASKFRRLVAYLEPRAIIAISLVADALKPDVSGAIAVHDGELLHIQACDPGAPTMAPRLPAGDDLAFIQCTSGSTGKPKGVMITHANLVNNCEQIRRKCQCGTDDTWVGWLPLNHDMGLIGGTLTPLYSRTRAVQIPPALFLRRPAEWLLNVSRYQGTITAAPNFAYGYAAARIKDEELDGVDLSSWRFMFCGAEPIQFDTVSRFVERFRHWGLPENSLIPCYGLAEASLAVTVSRPQSISFDVVDRHALATARIAKDTTPEDPAALTVVDCGTVVDGAEIRIADEDGTVLGENALGHIQFRGPATTAGYFGLPEETAKSMTADGWWDSGDIGYLRDGGLRVTGRAKDIIIIRGANYFPSNFEHAAESVAGVRVGGVAAVGHTAEGEDSESLHLIVETEVDASVRDSLRRAVRSAVSARTGVLPAAIHLVPKRSIPKTTSGKVQRSKAKRLFVEREQVAQQ